MILMVTNKHEESVALCIYHFPGVIGFWNCWFSRKGKMRVGKEKKPLEERKKGREPTTESTQTSHCLCDSKYEATLGGSECFHHYTTLVPYSIHVSKYPVSNKVINIK